MTNDNHHDEKAVLADLQAEIERGQFIAAGQYTLLSRAADTIESLLAEIHDLTH